MSWVVGQGPAAQVQGAGASVVNLDPVRELPILVGKGLFVIGHEFADNDLGTDGNREK